MIGVLTARGVYMDHWRRHVLAASNRDVSSEIRYFTVGAIAIATGWAMFPILFFDQLPPSARSTVAVILAGLAGGIATLLAPVRWLALTFLAIMLIPGSLRFLLAGGEENTILGLLGFICFGILSLSASVANQAIIRSIRLNYANQQLLNEKERERKQIAETNKELRTLQIALEESNLGLESKVQIRTEELMNEIRERERYEQELARIASTDGLTGLLNRTAVTHGIATAIAAKPRRAALLFLDLDRFKFVNDVLGHCTGDRVLSTVAQRLTERMPPGAILSRWGGDEFVLFLASIESENSILRLAAALRQAVVEPIDAEGERIHIDVSTGIALFPDHGTTPDALIRAADAAMYAAKVDADTRIHLPPPAPAVKCKAAHA